MIVLRAICIRSICHLDGTLNRRFPFTLSIRVAAFSDYGIVIQDRQFFGASCPRVKVGTERTTAKKRGQSPRRAATPVPAVTEGGGGREKDVIGSYCTGTVSSIYFYGTREGGEV